MANSYLFLEGDQAQCLYFLTKGECGFVLPSYDNTQYISIEDGSMFGLIDIHGSAQKQKFDLNYWNIKKALLQRHFTVRAQTEAEFLTLSYDNLHRMSQEFPEIYDKLMDDSFHLLRRVLLTKLLAMKHCRTQQKGNDLMRS